MKTTQILKANHISKNGLTIFADMDIGLLNADRQKKEDNLNRSTKKQRTKQIFSPILVKDQSLPRKNIQSSNCSGKRPQNSYSKNRSQS